MQPVAGNSFTPTSLVFGFDRSNTGPTTLTLRSSADGYSTDLGSVAVAASLTTGNTINIAGLNNFISAKTLPVFTVVELLARAGQGALIRRVML